MADQGALPGFESVAEGPAAAIQNAIAQAVDGIKKALQSSAGMAALELRNSALDVLSGQRSGRRYLVPGTRTYYTASAPGEAPAVRTGALRLGWMPSVHVEPTPHGFRILPGINLIGPPTNYAPILDPTLAGGGGGGLNRPFVRRIQEDALPRIQKLLP